ncbi:MAG TPA: diacylglycerol kinase family protein [Chitinophagaceae bacterium]|jgi:YegS/Rv2252/BmrU family lipid kinase|nr:diacylglycerol kinase family protein [Chitinophagaceae bacterium]
MPCLPLLTTIDACTMPVNELKILFIINPGSGKVKRDWQAEIMDYFKDKPQEIQCFELPENCKKAVIKEMIRQSGAAKIIAVGGDGTVKLVAECLLHTELLLGIIPAGSANGMARELDIPTDLTKALDLIIDADVKQIHLVKVNDELCIHLSDIGFNAYVVKKFEEEGARGMWGYVKAAFKALWEHRYMQVRIQTDEEEKTMRAAMVVIANATMYGNGVVINPKGTLFDDFFEVVVIRKISFREIFKMRFTQKGFNREKTEFFQTRSLSIASKSRAHFQVDGETMGKVKKLDAEIITKALNILVKKEEKDDGA